MEVFRDLGVVQLNLVPGKEVGGVQFTQARHNRFAALVHRLGVVEHADPAVGGVAQVDDLPQALAFQGGDGNDDLHNMVLAHQFGNIRDGSAHRHALHTQVLLGQVVVHDDHRVAEGRVFGLAQVDCPGARVARAHDQKGRAVPGGTCFGRAPAIQTHSAHQTPQEAHPRHRRDVEHRADDQHRAVKHAAADGHHQKVRHHDEAGGQPGQAHQPCQVPHAGILPHDLIQPAEPEHHHIGEKHIGHILHEGLDNIGPQVLLRTVEPQENGDVIAQHDQPAVQQHEQNAPGQALDELFVGSLHSFYLPCFPAKRAARSERRRPTPQYMTGRT